MPRAEAVEVHRQERADTERLLQLLGLRERLPLGIGCCIQPKVILAPSRSSVTGTMPDWVSSRISPSCSGWASTNADPRTGWPAKGSSLAGVKIRMRACPPLSGGKTNTVSERFISRARTCMVSSSTSRPSVKTASWLPVSGVSVKTSATT